MLTMVALSTKAKSTSIIIFGGFFITCEVARCEIFKITYSGRNELQRRHELVPSKNRIKENCPAESMYKQC